MLVVSDNLIRGSPVTHLKLRAPPADLVELIGQRPSGPFSLKPFQVVTNGLSDRFRLRPSGQ